MQGYLVLALVFAILVALFAIQNTALVVVRFLFWEAEISLVLVILGAAAAGALMMFFVNLLKQFAHNRERKELLKQNSRLQTEKDELSSVLAQREELIEEKGRQFQEKNRQWEEREKESPAPQVEGDFAGPGGGHGQS